MVCGRGRWCFIGSTPVRRIFSLARLQKAFCSSPHTLLGIPISIAAGEHHSMYLLTVFFDYGMEDTVGVLLYHFILRRRRAPPGRTEELLTDYAHC